MEDTICAIATPLGEGGIGIVRISGPGAIGVLQKVFRPRRDIDLAGVKNMLVYGHVTDKEGALVDEVLVGIMRKPFSYTREDVVEINCHGGFMPLKKTLGVVLDAGARMAEPGEFTRRAFLNGRLDLAQAEAVLDLIRARTDEGQRVAMTQLQGKLSRVVNELQDKLLSLLAAVEAGLDFPEEDAGQMDVGFLCSRAGEIKKGIDEILAGAGAGMIYREGAGTAIAGKPNAGKSSLLNALLRKERAIVTTIPGTTRDIIEETVNLRGIPLRLADMAGLRETDDPVEKIGVQRALETLQDADLVLFLCDATTGITPEDRHIAHLIGGKKTIGVINKTDVAPAGNLAAGLSDILGDVPVVEISALTEKGIIDLENSIFELLLGGSVPAEGILVSSMRHVNSLKRAAAFLQQVMVKAGQGLPFDLLAIDLREAWEVLGEITGTSAGENLIERIFNDFCIGK